MTCVGNDERELWKLLILEVSQNQINVSGKYTSVVAIEGRTLLQRSISTAPILQQSLLCFSESIKAVIAQIFTFYFYGKTK